MTPSEMEDQYDRAFAAARALVRECSTMRKGLGGGAEHQISLGIQVLKDAFEELPGSAKEEFAMGLGMALASIFTTSEPPMAPSKIRGATEDILKVTMMSVRQFEEARRQQQTGLN